MRRRPIISLLVLLGVSLGHWATGPLGHSSVEAALTVEPVRIVLRAKPAQSLAGVFTVENAGQTPVHVLVEPEDWSGGVSGPRQQVDWLTVKPAALTLGPGRRSKVKYRIRVPRDASGELRVQVFFTTEESGANQVKARSRLGTIIYVAIRGTEEVRAEIADMTWTYTASTPGIAKPDRFEVVTAIANHGNVHVVPEGWILLEDGDGQTLHRLTLESGWGLLPAEQETYRAVGSGVYLKPGHYQLEAHVIVGNDLGQSVTLTKRLELSLSGEEGSAQDRP